MELSRRQAPRAPGAVPLRISKRMRALQNDRIETVLRKSASILDRAHLAG